MISQKRSVRKPSGGKYHAYRKKKMYEAGSSPALTKVDKTTKVRKVRAKGGIIKLKTLTVAYANVLDPKTKKAQKAAIKTVVENTANRNYVRRNIFNKGAIIETELGKAKVTSRPGQDGVVNAVLVEK
ncbi:MAG: 30S ribosomal protein S8e [Candidatus Woesearchaeota archaeon]